MTRAGGSAKRRSAEARGRRAELLASLYMRFFGFEILTQRFKAHGGEIDLIARRKRLLVFAEVKARHTYDQALEAVTRQNRRRIEQAGRAFISRNAQFADYDLRYDIIAVSGWRIKRLTDAWREGD